MWVHRLVGENPTLFTGLTVYFSFLINFYGYLVAIPLDTSDYLAISSNSLIMTSYFGSNFIRPRESFCNGGSSSASLYLRLAKLNYTTLAYGYNSNDNNHNNNGNSQGNDYYHLSKFYSWFVGFTDAEGCFLIHILYNKDKTKVKAISFVFQIQLHEDDANVLEYIHIKLGVGKVTRLPNKSQCLLLVTDKEGVNKLFNIFDKYQLKTTKYFDYLDFKKAFLLYHERDTDLSIDEKEQLFSKIKVLKNNMNKQRTLEDIPVNQKVTITKSWLLGFIEGDGSFFISRTDIEPGFSIELKNTQFFVIDKIKEFLINNLGFDKYSISKIKSSDSNIISVNKQSSRPSIILLIKNINLLYNYLIPFFDNITFYSKKGLDFQDFKFICKAVYFGSHKRDDIRRLIVRLSYTMNNYRLSTNPRKELILTSQERDHINNASPTWERLLDGRLRELATGKVRLNISNCVYEVIRPDGEVLILQSLKDVLNILGVGFKRFKKDVNEDTLWNWTEYEGYKIRRVPVFVSKCSLEGANITNNNS